MESINFCGIHFRGLKKSQIFNNPQAPLFVVTVNAEFIARANRDPHFMQIINDNHATFDGQIPYLLAHFLHPLTHFSKISGSDLIYDACEQARLENKRLFLLGGCPTSNDRAVEKIRQQYGIQVGGYSPAYQPYPFTPVHDQAILDRIQKFKPDYLFVAFGAVKQEYWIHDHLGFLESQGIQLVVGCGGALDFVAGKVKRAPVFVQKAGMEGLWRFLAEPRLFRLRRLLLSTRLFNEFYKHHIIHRHFAPPEDQRNTTA